MCPGAPLLDKHTLAVLKGRVSQLTGGVRVCNRALFASLAECAFPQRSSDFGLRWSCPHPFPVLSMFEVHVWFRASTLRSSNVSAIPRSCASRCLATCRLL